MARTVVLNIATTSTPIPPGMTFLGYIFQLVGAAVSGSSIPSYSKEARNSEPSAAFSDVPVGTYKATVQAYSTGDKRFGPSQTIDVEVVADEPPPGELTYPAPTGFSYILL